MEIYPSTWHHQPDNDSVGGRIKCRGGDVTRPIRTPMSNQTGKERPRTMAKRACGQGVGIGGHSGHLARHDMGPC